MTTPAASCADPNPWDARILCELPTGHEARHQANYTLRWDDLCHFPGDDCRPAHPVELGESA